MNPIWLEEVVRAALNEDIGNGDITTEAVVPPGTVAEGAIIAKAPGRIAGTAVATLAFRLLDPSVMIRIVAPDGKDVVPGDTVMEVRGPAAAVLMGERVALNFLQQLSGVATATTEAVAAAAPYGTHIVDTRKTTPGLRALEKYAVRVGGGMNHRIGLYDAVLIKENHIAVAGGIRPAVERVRARAGHMVKVEVEVERFDQIDEALESGVDAILLDNMDAPTMQTAVQHINHRVVVEASGSISTDQIAAVAATGVDIISMGRLTHSSPALDLSLRIQLRR
jgi:nicotinate-nucleotide pyrophosphorylase (carboxylating)